MSRESDRQHKRATIRDATLRLVGERGLQATSMQDIAAASDVSVATVYNHFPAGKEEILLTAVSFALSELQANLEPIAQIEDPVAAIRACHRVYAHFCHHRGDIVRVSVRVSGYRDRPEFVALRQKRLQFLAGLFERAIQQGAFPATLRPMVCAKLQMAMLHVLMSDAVGDPDAHPEDALAESMDRVVFHGLTQPN